MYPSAERPAARWFEPLTPMFRGVDCANPSVDFSGCLIVGSDAAVEACEIDRDHVVRVRSACVAICGDDGPGSIERIADFEHLHQVIRSVCNSGTIDLVSDLANERRLLEAYTCHPVVPLAFLLRSGLVASIDALPTFLERHPLTLSGGLNLGKAPANNTTLSALIHMVHRLRNAPTGTIGLVHSITALGHK